MSQSLFPDLNLSMSDKTTSGASGSFGTSFGMPDGFDHSAWNVSIGSSGNQGATGSTGQGAGATSPAAGLLAGIKPQWLLVAGLVFILLRNK